MGSLDHLYDSKLASIEQTEEFDTPLVDEESKVKGNLDQLYSGMKAGKSNNLDYLYADMKPVKAEEVNQDDLTSKVSLIAKELKAEELRDVPVGEGTVQGKLMKKMLAPSLEEYDVTKPGPLMSDENKAGFMTSLRRIWDAAQNPYDVVKGTATLVSAIPGFAAAFGSALIDVPLEIGKNIIQDKSFTFDDLYNSASGQFSTIMEMWDKGVTQPLDKVLDAPRKGGEELSMLIFGGEKGKERTPDTAIVADIFMAPYNAVAQPLHALANSETYNDYPNARGIIKFAADGLGLALMGRMYKGGPEKFAEDVKPLVDKAANIDKVQKDIANLPDEALKQAQQKILDAQKQQLELEAAEIQKNLDYEQMIKEDLSARGRLAGQARAPKKAIVDEQVNKALEWTENKYSILETHFGSKEEMREFLRSEKDRKKIERTEEKEDRKNFEQTAEPEAKAKELIKEAVDEVSPTVDVESVTKMYNDLGIPLDEAKELAKFDLESDIKGIYERETGKKVESIDDYKEMLDYWDQVREETQPPKDIDVDLKIAEREPVQLSTEQSPFRAEPERTEFMSKWFAENKWDGSLETITAKHLNDVNSWLDGKKVDVAEAKNSLSTLAAMLKNPEYRVRLLDEFGGDPTALGNFQEMVSEAAQWARNADRSKIKRTESTVQLNSFIDPKDVVRIIKDIKNKMLSSYGPDRILSTSGYIFEDGKTAKLTFDKDKNTYSMPHEDAVIEALNKINDNVSKKVLQSENMLDAYLNSSNVIRYVRELNGDLSIELRNKPSNSQIKLIRDVAKDNNINVDIAGKYFTTNGRSLARDLKNAFIFEPGTKLFDITQIPAEAAKQLKSIATRAKTFVKSYKDSAELKKFNAKFAAGQITSDVNRSLIDQLETLLKQVRKQYPKEVQKIVDRQRSAVAGKGYGMLLYEQMKKELTKGLTKEQEELMGIYVLARRLKDIYSYKSKKYKAQAGYGPDEVVSATALIEMANDIPQSAWDAAKKSVPEMQELFGKLTSEQVAQSIKAGEGYFEWMRRIVDDLVKAGIKSKEEGELLKAHDFRKFKSLRVEKLYDFGYDMRLRNETIKTTASGVESLGWGSHKIIEPDPWPSAHEMLARAQGAIANQKAKLEWKGLAEKHPENGIVSEKRQPGWSPIPYFEEGKRKYIYFHPDAAKYLVTKSHDLSSRLTSVARVLMLAPVTRALAVGTSPVWSTFVGLPMDIIHSIFSARTFDSSKGKFRTVYNPIPGVAPLQIGRDMARTFYDTYTRGEFFQDYMKHGGAMPFLTLREGRYTRGVKPPGTWSKFLDLLSYHGLSMETWVRTATADRVIRKRAKEQGITYEQARKNEDIMYEAVHAARDRMDYNQGGWFVKALDQLGFIFLNAGTLGFRTFWRQAKDNPVDFTMKTMQIGATAVGLATVGWLLYPEVMKDIPDEGNEKNLIIPLFPDYLSAIDRDGNKVYFYAKLRLDPGAAFMYKMFDALTRTYLYDRGLIDKEPDYGKLVQTLKQLGPYGLSLPPTIQSGVEYMANYSWWKDRDMYTDLGGKTLDWPNSKQEGIYGEGARNPNLSQMAVDVGQVTGLSPVRLQGAVGNIIPRNNEFVQMISGAYEHAFSDVPEEMRNQHWMLTLAQLPGINKIIGVTRPGYNVREAGVEPRKEAEVESMNRNKHMDFITKNYYWRGIGERKDIRNYVRSFKDENIQDSLIQKEKFIRDVKDVPNRSAWVSMFHTTPEAKAKHWKKLYGSEFRGNEVFRKLMRAGYLSDEGLARFTREMRNLSSSKN